MSGEMVDAFADRQAGVQTIARHFEQALSPARVQVYAGDAGWLPPAAAGAHWRSVASANWLALARHAAVASPLGSAGLVLDIGSTTSDLIAFADGCVLTQARSDADRLASGELVYQGVVRTPLCALGPAVHWRGRDWPLVNEFFATTADVHRLCGGLDPAHDLQPAADQGAKDLPSTRQRLARMLGLDAHEASAQAWLALAEAWRQRQLDDLAAALQRVLARHGLQARPGRPLRVLTAGCGAFLVPPLLDGAARALGWPRAAFSEGPYAALLQTNRPNGAWDQAIQVAAPAAAVAALLAREVG
jgi:probable H4MPT-linked C1 transfer pathway protein